ncbi:queuosine precursor transporter [Mycoplasma sp. P36-A1]|uniref:queuosine precursor transporter n=1 Tax=Mycoplasma sp. P36-A1 TaxID=3252900 RepID=UPI003C2B1300
MSNELLLIISVFIYFGLFLVMYKLFGKYGLVVWNVVALLLANIEVMLLVNAFGMTMTLGNVAFATSFLVSDLVCEKYDRKTADRIVMLGFIILLAFIAASQLWLHFSPAEGDVMMSHFKLVFSNSPRIIFAGLFVYVIVQLIDVRLYYMWWGITKKFNKDESKYLWIRNNGSTLISQLLNAILFNLVAFYGVFSNTDLINVIISTYIIYIFTSLIDTPFLYLCRKIKPINLLDI